MLNIYHHFDYNLAWYDICFQVENEIYTSELHTGVDLFQKTFKLQIIKIDF